MAALAALAAAAGCGQAPGGANGQLAGGRGPAMRLRPSALGSPVGGAVSAVVGAAGATLSSPDGRLTVTVPAGALPEGTEVTLQPITDTAPAGVGSAFRLGPSGALAQPATLSFRPDLAGAGAALEALTVATQNGEAFWLRHRDVARDAAAGKLSLAVSHFSDWAVVAANTASDLRGRFTLTSTLGTPFTAVGDATLNYGGDDAQGAHYLQWGALALQAPVTVGALACDLPAPSELLANVADLSPARARFDWGVSGHWALTCRDAAGNGASASIATAFDTFGINDIGCARGWVGTPLITLAQASGTYAIDCGASGRITADLDFRTCTPGGACVAGTCRTAAVSCAGTYAACVDTGPAPDGAACGGGVCGAGVCNACVPGQACASTTGECTAAAQVCGSGFPVCTDGGNRPDGTPCTGGVCGAGLCNPCAPGAACSTNPDPCKAGAVACGTGFPVCADAAAPATDGTACPGGVCGGGLCNACIPGQGCASASECKTAGLVCASGFPVCTDSGDKAAGVACTGGVCSGAGACNACLAGQGCSVAGDPCAAGSLVCSSGAPVCTRTGALGDGTPCGAGQTCNAGSCVASSAVTGTRLVTFWSDAGALPPALPADAGVVTVKALVPDVRGGYRAYPGSFDAGGAFAIPNVPDGATFWLVLTDGAGVTRAVQTADRNVDLGFDRLGRPGAAFPSVATPVGISVDGLVAAWQPADLLQLVASNADLLDEPPTASFAPGASAGSTVEDWNASGSGGRLPLLAADDTVLLHHLASAAAATTGGGAPFTYHALSAAAAVTGLALQDGNPAPAVALAPTLTAPGASSSVSPDWRTTQFEALVAGLVPAGTADRGAHTLRISASAGPLTGAAPVAGRGTPDLLRLVVGAGSGDLAFGPLAFGLPSSPPWSAWQGVELAVSASYTLPPAAVAVSAVAAVGQREPLAGPPVSPIVPLLGPVQDPRVGPASLLGTPLTGVGASPTFSWTAPAVGVPARYQLEIFALGVSGSATTSSLVASFTTAATQLVLPPGVLAAGTTCFARITARDAPVLAPLRSSGMGAYASTLTATFTP